MSGHTTLSKGAAHDAQINVVYVGRESGHPSAMMLPVTVRSNTLELLPTVQVPLLP